MTIVCLGQNFSWLLRPVHIAGTRVRKDAIPEGHYDERVDSDGKVVVMLARALTAHRPPSSGLESLHRETVVPASRGDTFAFFADAANLERLTPPWLNFVVLTPMPVAMWPGAEIDYRIRLYGLPIPWRSRIDVWEPAVRFVDRQVVGPYSWWRHEHRFESVAGGTLVVDHVEYVPRARWVSRRKVRRDLERIFTYRQHALQEIFAKERRDGARSA